MPMTNGEYDLTYLDLVQCKRLKFRPTPQLTKDDYEATLAVLTTRGQCQRLPRINEEVLVRTYEQAYQDAYVSNQSATLRSTYVVAEGDDGKGHVCEVMTADGDRLTKALYKTTWWFAPGCGPKTVSQEVA